MAVLSNSSVSAFFESGELTLENVSYEPYKIKNTVCACDGIAGASCSGVKSEPTRVTLEGYIKGDTLAIKKALGELCTPSTPILLSDNGYTLELFAESALELSNEAHLRDKLLKYRIKAIAPTPFWRGAEKSQLFRSCANVSTDTNAIKITNEGELPIGCIIEVRAMTICDSVMLRIGAKRFEYEMGLESSDRLFIDTRYGKKSVTLQRSGESERVSVIEHVAPSSEFFELPTGETRIDFNILNGLAYITITQTPMYLR